jgi:hypothetical protein
MVSSPNIGECSKYHITYGEAITTTLLLKTNARASGFKSISELGKMSNYELEGVMEHVVNTPFEFLLRVSDQNGSPCDSDKAIKAMLKGSRDNHYTVEIFLFCFSNW